MTDEERPVLRVVRGELTAEELAALVAVLASRSTPAADRTGRHSAWTDRSRLVRRCPSPGPGAWRASAWPS